MTGCDVDDGSVLLFRILAFSLVSSCAVSVLGAIPCKTDRILFPESLSGGTPYSKGDLVLSVYDSI